MAGRRERFGGEPSGEPEWMREVGRGGLPGAHNKETSWPAAGFAAHNAQASKNKRTRAKAQAPIARRSPTHKSRAELADGANTHQRRPKGGKDGGGCSCGGSGNCNSEGGGPGHVGSREVRGGPGGPVEATPSKIINIPRLVASVRRKLAEGKVVATEAELEGILLIALSSLRPSNRRPSNRRPSNRRPSNRRLETHGVDVLCAA
jgi:hypothetical protein